MYLLGQIQDAASFEPSTIDTLPYVRHISWTHRVPRDSLSVTTRNALGAIQTFIRLNAGPRDPGID